MRLILLLLVIYCVYRYFKGRSRDEIASGTPDQHTEETYKDPVCGVYVARDDAIVGTVEGERFYFCSMTCLEKYKEQLEHKSS